MIFSVKEILDIVLMTVALGFIFKDYFKKPTKANEPYDPIKALTQKDQSSFWLAMLVIAPGIILHEFGHKFVALGFGASATFEAAYTFLLIAVILKLAKSPFLFFVPAYVAWSGTVSHEQVLLIALAGPAVNFFIWLGAHLALKYKKVPTRHISIIMLTRKINGFLAIFNMLPIPFFDGFHVYKQLFIIFF